MPEAALHVASGKVREIYELDEERLLLVASDRISTFDVVLPTEITDKGRVLTGLSGFWFARTRDIVPNHLLALRADGRSTEVRRLRMLPIECVVRGYLAGSGWKDYQADGTTSGHVLPEGLRESDKLPQPISRRRRRPRPGTTRTSTARARPSSSAKSSFRRSKASRSSSIASPPSTPPSAESLSPTPSSSSASTRRTVSSWETKLSRRIRRASGRPTSTSPGGDSPHSTSSSSAITARPSGGARPAPVPSFPRTWSRARGPGTWRPSSG